MSEQKIALVTGANKGIGREICKQLLEKGFIVYLAARKKTEGEKAARELSAGGKPVHFLLMDVTSIPSIQRAARAFAKKSLVLDVLINNAGIMLDTSNNILNSHLEAFEDTFRTNTLGAVFVTRVFLPYLEQSSSGRVINLSSGAGALGEMQSFAPAYSISKTALNAVTRQLAAELRVRNIAVNSMCPGWVRTDMGGKEAPRSVEQGADTAVWLATEAPGSLTGEFIRERERINW